MSYYGDPIADLEYFKRKMLSKLGIPKELFNSHTINGYRLNDDLTYKLMMDQFKKEIEDGEEQLAYPSSMRDAGIFLVK